MREFSLASNGTKTSGFESVYRSSNMKQSTLEPTSEE